MIHHHFTNDSRHAEVIYAGAGAAATTTTKKWLKSPFFSLPFSFFSTSIYIIHRFPLHTSTVWLIQSIDRAEISPTQKAGIQKLKKGKSCG
jgi:hypothetical protein